MAYQSIFNSAGVISLPNIQAQFVPGQYAKVNAAIAARQPVNPQTLTSAPALTTALKAGQINQNQFAQRYNSIFNKPVAAPTSLLGQVKQYGASALGNAITKTGKQIASVPTAIVKPTSDVLLGENNKAVQAAGNLVHDVAHQGSNIGIQPLGAKIAQTTKYLAQPGATAAQRATLINHQNLAATNPEYLKATQGMNPKEQTVRGVNQAQALAASGAKAPQIKSVLQKDHKAYVNNVKSGAAAGVALVGLTAGGGEAAGLKDVAENGLKTLAKKTVTDASIGGVTNAASTVASNPNATGKQVLKSGALGAALGGAVPVVGKAVGASGEALSTALGKNKEVNQFVNKSTGNALLDAVNKARSQAITRPSALDNVELPEDTATVPKTAETGATRPTESTTAPTTAKPVQPVTKPAPLTTPGEKVSGSSIRTQAKAVEAGMKSDEDITGATYKTVSHKAEAQKAVQLLQDDPDKAKDIAMGRAEGNNASHEAAVYHAVANDALTKAKETGDFSTVRELANSPRHTGVSEAAQKLGAEGYNVNPHDPVSIMGDIAKSREKALSKSGSNTVDKELAKVTSDVKANTPRVTRQTWSDFVDQLKC